MRTEVIQQPHTTYESHTEYDNKMVKKPTFSMEVGPRLRFLMWSFCGIRRGCQTQHLQGMLQQLCFCSE
jgi:hypothetical protein